VKHIARRVGNTASIALVAFAVVIVGTVFLKSQAEARRAPSGVELMTDFGTRYPLSTPGRVDRQSREVTMGEGPDTVGLMALGRKPSLKAGTIDFADDAAAGRVVIDVPVVGSGFHFSALVDTHDETPSILEPLWSLFRGPRPAARSALMLLGDNGRYVALVVAANGREPTLEWVLGPDKRGLMQAPLPVKREGQRISLRMDAETGELFAVSGEGRDARVLGDGVWLGPYWRQLLGDSPRMAVGCLEGRCIFRQVQLQGLDLPAGLSPPPLPREDVLAPDDSDDQQSLKMGRPSDLSSSRGVELAKSTSKTVAQKSASVKPSSKPGTRSTPGAQKRK
jgi:hypothetical protein